MTVSEAAAAATRFISDYGLGNWASVIGLGVAVVGFWLTVRAAGRAKTAAEAAETAARQTRSRVAATDTLAELSAVIVQMETIKRIHREQAWRDLPDRYSAARKTLGLIRSGDPSLSVDQKMKFQNAIQNLADMEQRVDQVIAGKEPNVPKLNKLISDHIDVLTEVLAEVRSQLQK